MQNYSIINVENSINSGQVFLWKKNNTNWYGISIVVYGALLQTIWPNC